MESWPLRLSLASSTLPAYPKVGFLCCPLTKAEARAQALLAALPEAEVLMGLPGVGPQVAAAYAGLIPEREESGKSLERSRLSRKGPPLLRRKLFMGALVAVRHEPWPTSFALGPLPQMNRRRMMGRLREYYAGQSLQVQGVA
jgi:transposase